MSSEVIASTGVARLDIDGVSEEDREDRVETFATYGNGEHFFFPFLEFLMP